ncbi:MAG: hypothetical protein WDO19_12900 [Bacteroidota bacterium]
MVIVLSAVSYGYGITTLIGDKSRVYKGGSWNDMAYWLSPGTRRFMEEDQASSTVGFRCAMDRMGSPKATSAKQVTGGKQEDKKDNSLSYQEDPANRLRGFLLSFYLKLLLLLKFYGSIHPLIFAL